MHLNQKLEVVHQLVHSRKPLCTAHAQCTSPTFHTEFDAMPYVYAINETPKFNDT